MPTSPGLPVKADNQCMGRRAIIRQLYRISMKFYSNVYEVKTVCRLQKRLLSFSQFLSYFPLTNVFLTPSSYNKMVTIWQHY